MYNQRLIPPNLESSSPYLTLKTILNSVIILPSNFLILLMLIIEHTVTYCSSIKLAMLHIKMMLLKMQIHFA